MKRIIKINSLLLIILVSFMLNGCKKDAIEEEAKQEEIKEDSVKIDREKLIELNAILKTSFYESELEIDDKGNVFRTDNNGSTFEYSLTDIKEVKTEYDGFYNLLILFKEEKFALTIIQGVESNQTFNVFSFASSYNCQKAKKILAEIIAK